MSGYRKLLYIYLGKVAYTDALDLQNRVRENLASKNSVYTGVLMMLYHNPVITIGKYGDKSNILYSSVELQEKGVEFYISSRGGDATYHGPGQLVCYPVINLKKLNSGVRNYIESLESIIIKYLSAIGIEAKTVKGYPGVWSGNSKIASIGVRISRNITTHGFALNLSDGLYGFGFINPCGMKDRGITSVEELTGTAYQTESVARDIAGLFVREFNIDELVETCDDLGLTLGSPGIGPTGDTAL